MNPELLGRLYMSGLLKQVPLNMRHLLVYYAFYLDLDLEGKKVLPPVLIRSQLGFANPTYVNKNILPELRELMENNATFSELRKHAKLNGNSENECSDTAQQKADTALKQSSSANAEFCVFNTGDNNSNTGNSAGTYDGADANLQNCKCDGNASLQRKPLPSAPLSSPPSPHPIPPYNPPTILSKEIKESEKESGGTPPARQAGDGQAHAQADTPTPTDPTEHISAVAEVIDLEAMEALEALKAEMKAQARTPQERDGDGSMDNLPPAPTERDDGAPNGLTAVVVDTPALFADLNNGAYDARDNYEETFAEFWRMYPGFRKGNKKKAFAKYVLILKNKEATHEMIMAGLRRWCASEEWSKDNHKYVPHPTVWLNQERWEWTPPTASDSDTELSIPCQEQFYELCKQYENLAKKKPNVEASAKEWAVILNLYPKAPFFLPYVLTWAWRSPKWDEEGGKYIPQLATWLANDERYAEYGTGWYGDYLEWKDNCPREFSAFLKACETSAQKGTNQ